MNHLSRQNWVSLLLLVVFFVGCTSPRVPVQSEINGKLFGEKGKRHDLKAGDNVVVVLMNGTEERGEVLKVLPGTIVLGHIGNYGYNEIQIESATIDRIELVTTEIHWPRMIAGVVVGVVGLSLAFAHGMSQLR